MAQRNALYKLLQTFNTAKFWILGGIFCIVMLTLFPFKFEAIAWGKKDAIKQFFRNPSDAFDFFGNILLFMPFGYGLSQWLKSKSFAPVIKFSLIFSISLATTIAVETLQLFQPDRSSSIIDIFTNTLGGTLGGAIGLLGLDQIIAPTQQWLVRHWQKKRSLTIALGLWIALMLGSTWQLSTMTKLSNWDPNYNLMVGNEATGDRPWQGKVQSFSIADRALSESEVQQFLQSSAFPTLNQSLADYDLTGNAPYLDRSRFNSPPLESRPANPAASNSNSSWYITQEPPIKLNEALQKNSAFTLATTFETRSLKQEGPARIISLSLNTGERNLTLGQNDRQLIVRLRTPITGRNGDALELRSPNNLQQNRSHRVVLTYENSVLALYLDPGNPPDHLRLRPELTFFRLLLPNQLISLPRGPKAISLYPILFYAIWFLPLGTLLGRLLNLLKFRNQDNLKKTHRNLSTLTSSLILGLTIGGSSLAMATMLKSFSGQIISVGITCFGLALLPIAIQLLHPIFTFRQTR